MTGRELRQGHSKQIEAPHTAATGGAEQKGNEAMSVTSTLPRIFPDDTARTRRDDHVTSHEAADLTDPAASRRFVMFALIEHGRLAQFELERIADGLWSPSRVRTAVSELVERGLVEFAGIYRLTPSGRRAQVWVAS